MTRMQGKPFLEEGTSAIHGLRRALSEALNSLGAPLDEPQEVSRRYALDKTLTWRVARLIGERDVWEAVAHVPRRPSFKIFIDALTKKGLAKEIAADVNDAVENFERFVVTHAGDRETLEIMASVMSKRSSEKRLEVFRRDGYLAASAIWGVRADAQIVAHFVSPGSIAGRVDCATVCGLAGFRRLRINVPWAIATIRMWDTSEEMGDAYERSFEPVDNANERGSAPLMREFCSRDLAPVTTVKHDSRTMRLMLEGNELGNTGATDVFLGWINRNFAPALESYEGEWGEHGVSVTTPCAEFVHDLYIHRDLNFMFEEKGRVFSQLPGGAQYMTHGPDQALELPVPNDVADLGVDMSNGDISAFPRYREMVHIAAQRLNADLRDFQIRRYRLTHPPIPSMMVMRHTLGRRP